LPDVLITITKPSHKVNGRIQVPEQIAALHPLVKQTKPHFGQGRDTYGRVSAGRDGLDICVSPEQVGRACRIMDAAIKALEQRGGQVVIDPSDRWKRPTHAKVEGETIRFGLDEALQRRKNTNKDTRSYSEYEFAPNGRLMLRIKHEGLTGCRARWCDGPRGKLEGKLNSFLSGLWATAEFLKKQRHEREAWQKQWAEEQRQREQQRQALEEEHKRRQALEAQALAWQRSRLLRAYVRARVKQQGPHALDSEFARWVAWAKAQADQLDPLKVAPSPDPTEGLQVA
jgi:hypothetical protein